ncbi:MAG: ATP-binding cassette domain-containing protein [Planctomycetota bacterium]|jgi:phospholipid/cholesterol/gamma-HCH transport system ATP-binding protein
MPDTPDIALSVFNLQYSVAGRQIIRGATFEVARGENFLILASSGAGKTTLMKLCAGILEPQRGTVFIEGKDLWKYSYSARRDLRLRLRFIFEEGVLLSNMTLFENISLPLIYHTHLDEKMIKDRVQQEMSHLRILEYANEFPMAVDRSVRRRAHVASALVLRPEILLVDNPQWGFDQEISNLVLSRFKRLSEEHNVTLVLASHTLETLSKVTDSIGILEGGKIVHSGTLGRIVDMLKAMEDSRLGIIE